MRHVRLPYVNNAKAVLLTIAINLAVVFLFHAPGGVTFPEVLWDSMICAVITTIINMWIAYTSLKKMRAEGRIPAQVPVSGLMQRLPQNPFALGAVYAVGFAALAAGANAAVLRFFDMPALAFWPWLAYKLIYATLLSAKIAEYCIFRYVQPDWASAGSAEQPRADAAAQPVKNPLPKISVFREMYASITANIAMNIIIGSALGGVVALPEHVVVLYPATVQSIPITGLVFGLISGVLVTRAIVKEVNASLLASRPEIPESAISDRRFSWMPVRHIPLIGFVCACTMVFSAVALPVVMAFFGISVMNFYQYTVFITLYAGILSKPLSYALVRRCSQPDYIRYALGRAKEA